MKGYIKKWLVTFAVFIVIDLIWLGIIAQPLYDNFIGDLLTEDPNWASALLFYALFVVGVIHFAINPALKDKSQRLAAKQGALFGFFTYMTYELTNYAVIDGWPIGLVPIDIAWGTALSGAVAALSYRMLNKLK